MMPLLTLLNITTTTTAAAAVIAPDSGDAVNYTATHSCLLYVLI